MDFDLTGVLLAAAALLGAALAGCRYLRLGRASGAAFPDSSRAELVYGAMAFGYVFLITAGVVLADAGYYRLWPLAGIAWVLLAWLRPWRPLTRADAATVRRDDLPWIAFPLAAALVMGMCLPVFDTRLEARDAGVYRLSSAVVERTGGIAYEDRLVAEMSPDVRAGFFPISEGSTPRSMGFYLQDRQTGRVVPQFLPVAAVAMAMARGVGGSAAAGHAGLMAMFLAALGMFFLARRLAGMLAAVLACGWLCINLASWWFVRYGAAEPFAQALILIACYALLVERETASTPHGLLAGWAMGLAWLTKLELLALVAALGPLFLSDALTGRMRVRSTRTFWAALAALGTMFFVHAWGWGRPYVEDVLRVPGTDLVSITLLALGGLIVATALLVWSSRSSRVPVQWVERLLCRGQPLGRRFRFVVSALLIGLMTYGYWFRAPGWDANNLRELGWIVSEAGLVLGVIGLVHLIMSARTPGGGTIIAVLLPVAALLLWQKQIDPGLLWAYRRYLPVVLPLAVLGAAVAVDRFANGAIRGLRAPPGGTNRSRVSYIAQLAAVGGVALLATSQMWSMTARYRPFNDLAGSDGMIRELAAAIEPGALVLVEARTARGLVRFEGALQHELGRDVLRLPAPDLDAPLVRQLLLAASRRGQPVYFLTSGFVVAAPWFHGEPLGEFRFETNRLEEPTALGVLPMQAERVFINARLYLLSAAGTLPRLSGRLDIGGFDDLYLDGPTLYQVEVEDKGRTYRWTRPLGRVFLRGMEAGTRRILIRMASSYPPSLGEQRVTVRLDEATLGTAVVGRGWGEYEFELPVDWHPPADEMPRLDIQAEPAWRPKALLGSRDPRTVGVAVDLIRWGD